MDKFLRFFIKFHGYCIAIASSILTILFTAIFSGASSHARWEDFVDLRYTGVPAFVFGILWMSANSFLFLGIFKEKKQLVYPFCAMFLLDLFLVILRDVYLMITDGPWYRTAFFNFTFPFLIFIIPYVILSMLALIRLFDIDPIARTEDDFVRFDRGPCNRENADRVTFSA